MEKCAHGRLFVGLLIAGLLAFVARADESQLLLAEREIHATTLELFPKWLAALKRHASSRGRSWARSLPCTLASWA
jgi:hypothetical protein